MKADSGATPRVSVVMPTYNRKDDAVECVESLLKSSWTDMEIIVVDNASIDGTSELLRDRFGDRIRLVRSEENLYAGGGRNLGAAHARGEWLVFVDSDNIVDPGMLDALVKGASAQPAERLGLYGPLMYYADRPDTICLVSGDISLWTSLTHWIGNREQDTGQYRETASIPTGHIPNLFMIRRSLYAGMGGIEARYQMHYEESDLAERVKRLGRDVLVFPQAKTWHKIPYEKPKGDKQFDGQHNQLLYYSVRNRIWYMKRFASALQRSVYFLVFGPLLLAIQLAMCLRNGQPRLLSIVAKGYWDGWRDGLKPAKRTGVSSA